jgi:hypothetical protein
LRAARSNLAICAIETVGASLSGVGARAAAFAKQEGLIVWPLIGDVLTLRLPLVIKASKIEESFNRRACAPDKTLRLGDARRHHASVMQ